MAECTLCHLTLPQVATPDKLILASASTTHTVRARRTPHKRREQPLGVLVRGRGHLALAPAHQLRHLRQDQPARRKPR